MSDLVSLLNAEPRSTRLANLATLVSDNRDSITDLPLTDEVNNHVHTSYSFSPYSPTFAAWMARSAGLRAVGSVDHDSIAAAPEMLDAAQILRIGSTVGFEMRVNFEGTSVAGRRLNNPDSLGIGYIVIHGVARPRIKDAAAFLAPINKRRNDRNRAQIQALNALLDRRGLPQLTWDAVVAASRAEEGGSITERHILYTLGLLLIGVVGAGPGMSRLLSDIGLSISPRLRGYLDDEQNPHYVYDLLGALKSGFLPRFFIQPDHAECINVAEAVSFAQSIDAIPAYAYLGDIGDSPTGDKEAQQFEDSYLEELIAEVVRIGFRAVTYMPPRNTREQLQRVQRLCSRHELIEISGVDINSSRQAFTCPEVMEPEFAHLNDSTWALIAHEKLTSVAPTYSIFGESELARGSLADRVARYASIGRAMDPAHPESVLHAAKNA